MLRSHSIACSLFALALAAGCASDPSAPGSDDSPTGKADGIGADIAVEELSFSCLASCGFEDCTADSDRDELVAELEASHGSKLVIVPVTPKDQWRFDFPCENVEEKQNGQQYDGFTVEVAVLPIPFDPTDMDWKLCTEELASHFEARFAFDMSQIGTTSFPQLKPGSKLGKVKAGKEQIDRREFTADVVDAGGKHYVQYSASFNLGCMAGNMGTEILN